MEPHSLTVAFSASVIKCLDVLIVGGKDFVADIIIRAVPSAASQKEQDLVIVQDQRLPRLAKLGQHRPDTLAEFFGDLLGRVTRKQPITEYFKYLRGKYLSDDGKKHCILRFIFGSVTLPICGKSCCQRVSFLCVPAATVRHDRGVKTYDRSRVKTVVS